MMDKVLIQFGEFLARVLGDETEVVLHDRTGRIVWIANGHITGRRVGMQEQYVTMSLLAQQAAQQGRDYISGYKSVSRKGTPLKSSSLFIRDENGRMAYVLCANQDISAYWSLREHLNQFIGDIPTAQQPDPQSDTMEDMIKKIILQEMERAKPFDLESRREKMQLIARLNARGVFAARGAVSTVCGLLHIAQPTLYKYLQEMRAGEEGGLTDEK